MSITSLMRPGRAVITATRSPSRIASSIEWVMNTDRKSTRLNSSHDQISYAVFCLKKKKKHRLGLTREDTNETNDRLLLPACELRRVANGARERNITHTDLDTLPAISPARIRSRHR